MPTERLSMRHIREVLRLHCVAAILKNGTDKTAPPTRETPVLFHANIRGPGYCN